MSNSKCVYYKEKEQKSTDGGITWVDTGNFRKGAIISTQAAQCGSFVTEYRWTKADYVCDNANKYKGYKQQVSHDNGGSWVDTGVVDIGSLIESNSRDCGYDEQWFVLTGDNDFICEEGSKYKKKEMKYTRNSGTTWNSFDPPKYEKGDLIAQTSTDCASMKVTYIDGTTKYFTGLTSIEENTDSNMSNAKEVIIYNGVTSIGDWAFNLCSSITSVTIPDSVTSIGRWAFNGCSSLASITLPDSVTSIGESAFYGCTSLTSITLPDSVTSIGESAFYGCLSLASITLPDSVTSIGDLVFSRCESLTSITIPNSVTSIGIWAFNGCSSLTSITLPDSVTSIGDMAFLRCVNLTAVTIPINVTDIGEKAFKYCESLATVTIQNSTSKLVYNNNAFANISSTAKLYVPSNLLADYQSDSSWTGAFGGGIFAIGYDEKWFVLTGDNDFICSEGSKYKKKEMKYTRDSGTTWNSFVPPKYEKGDLIESNSKDCPTPSMKVTYTDGTEKTFYNLTTIKSYHVEALANHSRVKEIVIYDGVTAIGEEAFEDCTNLTSITIPNSVTEIDNQAFNNCSSLTSVTIPDGVTSIGDNTFHGCKSFTSITIPDSVTTIGNQAFLLCSKLTSINIPNKVKVIGDYAFRACDSITSITIPDSVISIGKKAFYPSGIKTITFEATTPPNLGDNAIMNTDTKTTTIYVPASSVDKYKSATNWNSYTDNIYPIGAEIPAMKVVYLDGTEKTFINLKKIVKNTDSNKANAKEIEIYDSVVRIDIDAFENCTGLTSVKLGSSVKTIIDSAFANCSSLTSITLPNSVKTIGNNVFWGCSSLRTLIVQATTPPKLGISSGTIPKTVSTIYVPADSVNSYKSASIWRSYADKIQAIPQ